MEEIKEKFLTKFQLYDEMEQTDNPKELKELAEQVKNNEFLIQELFNFEKNYDYHRWWEMPKCKCPRMDNQDFWGTNRNIHTSDCKIHWEDLIER